MFCSQYKKETEDAIQRSLRTDHETVRADRQRYMFDRRHFPSFLRSNGCIFGRIFDVRALQPININPGDIGVESIFRYITHYEIIQPNFLFFFLLVQQSNYEQTESAGNSELEDTGHGSPGKFRQSHIRVHCFRCKVGFSKYILLIS